MYPEDQSNAGVKTFTYKITVLTVHVPDVGGLPYRARNRQPSLKRLVTVSRTNPAANVGDYTATLTLSHNANRHTNTA